MICAHMTLHGENKRSRFMTFPKINKGVLADYVPAVHKETAILFRKQWPKKKTGLRRHRETRLTSFHNMISYVPYYTCII